LPQWLPLQQAQQLLQHWLRLLRRPATHRQLRRRWLPLPRENLLRVAAQRQQVRPILVQMQFELLVAGRSRACLQAQQGQVLAEVRLGMHLRARIVSLRRMIGSWRSASLKLREDSG
jgi:hypothetical protein